MANGDVVQFATAVTSANATTLTVALSAASTSGNTILVFGSGDGVFTAPAGGGYTKDAGSLNFTDAPIFRRAATVTTESSIFTGNASTNYVLIMVEVQGTLTVDVATSNHTGTVSGTTYTGASVTTTNAADLIVTGISADWTAVADTVLSASNSFTILAEAHNTGTGTKVGLSVLSRVVAATGAYSTVSTFTNGSANGANVADPIVAYKIPGGGAVQAPAAAPQVVTRVTRFRSSLY